ncbi:MAG TPA: alpha/beta hydrolase [Dehalococcoidia bacterium]|nr:alpha/beta hydrolase [Dehalococcoidia bacterium]
MTPREGAVRANGIEVHYVQWGDDDAPPLLAVHPTGFLSWTWAPIAERLAERWRVIANDQRGHGDSAKPPDGYDFETFARDLQGLIEALGLRYPVAVGHSSGGTTLVVHAARFPGVVRALALIEPILPPPEWRRPDRERRARSAHDMRELALKRRAVWDSPDDMIASFRARPPFDTWTDEALRWYAERGLAPRPDGRYELKCPPALEAKFYEAVARLDPSPYIAGVTCPTLILWGARSELARDGFVERIHEAFGHATTRILDGTTHFAPMERPDVVAAELERFFAEGAGHEDA